MWKNEAMRWLLAAASVVVLLAFTGLPRVSGGGISRGGGEESVARWVWTERSANFALGCSFDNPICLEWCEPVGGGLVGTRDLCCRSSGEDPMDPVCNEVPQ